MVHNLGLVAWDKLSDAEYGYDWALEAREKMKRHILSGDFRSLVNYESQGKEFQLSIPTPEHYLPLLYALALKEEDENIAFFNDKAIAGSLAMTSLKIAKE
jgi:4,5-DOPA dioxygenase extradiol